MIKEGKKSSMLHLEEEASQSYKWDSKQKYVDSTYWSAPLTEAWRGSVSIAIVIHTERGRQAGPWGHMMIRYSVRHVAPSCERSKTKRSSLHKRGSMGQHACHQHWGYTLQKSNRSAIFWKLHMGGFSQWQSANTCKLSVKRDDKLLTKSQYDLQADSVIINHGGSELSPTLPCSLHKEWPKHLPRKRDFLNWWKIALQRCIGFCRTAAWISHNHTNVSSLLSFFPSPRSTSLDYQRTRGWTPYVIQQLFSFLPFYTW